MLDILGREVSRGDIITFGSSKGGHIRYTRTSLGIVNNVLDNRVHLKDSAMYNKIFKDQLAVAQNIGHMPADVVTIAKVTFYPLHLSDKHLNNFNIINNNKIHANGKPKRGIVLTTEFLKVNVEDLSTEWMEAYTEARKAFKI